MYVPRVHERVLITGRAGVFVVVWVDHDNQGFSGIWGSRFSRVDLESTHVRVFDAPGLPN